MNGEARARDGSPSAAPPDDDAGRDATTCPFCRRQVDTYPAEGVELMFGHRVTFPNTIETPWCEGGGRAAR